MNTLLVVAVLAAWSLQYVPGCGATKGERRIEEGSASLAPEQTELHKIYVEPARSAASVKAGEDVVLGIHGNLPSPAYKLDRVNVNIKGKVIELTPLATLDRGVMAAQVLVPFSDSVKVKLPEPGEYVVRVVGRTENRESKIRVK